MAVSMARTACAGKGHPCHLKVYGAGVTDDARLDL
jgi:hypothetical protein